MQDSALRHLTQTLSIMRFEVSCLGPSCRYVLKADNTSFIVQKAYLMRRSLRHAMQADQVRMPTEFFLDPKPVVSEEVSSTGCRRF
jgi:hypothetical protein